MKLSIETPNFLEQIPHLPGVYRYYSKDDELLYVGKALNLYKRVKSYFQKTANVSPRISLMVYKIAYIELTVTDNEVSALILENNLIKSQKPKYNIIFRDDKTYLAIRLTAHDFPKIESFRSKHINQTNRTFGPYPNSYAAKQSIDMLQKIFKLRTCSDNFFNNRTRPCILYQIKRCSAPCVDYISKEAYAHDVNFAVQFLKGDQNKILNLLTEKMNKAVDVLAFEDAAHLRDQISQIKQLAIPQIISDYTHNANSDIVLVQIENQVGFIYVIEVRGGSYVLDKHFIVRNLLSNEIKDLGMSFLTSYYLEVKSKFSIVTSIAFDDEFIQLFRSATGVKLETKIPKKLKLIEKMGESNLKKIRENYFDRTDLSGSAMELSKLLKIGEINRIECIDVSHNQGDDTVASIVVYQGGIIDHSQYRRYNLSGTNGDDLKALEEVVSRRISQKENPYPEIFLIDGGISQFKKIKNLLASMQLCGRIMPVAIFKGEKRKAEFDQIILEEGNYLSAKNAPLIFKLLQTLRDEAHRFAISGHRKKQIKKMEASVLLEIPDIGIKKRRALVNYFGSVKEVVNASIDELQKVEGIGLKLANQIYKYFH